MTINTIESKKQNQNKQTSANVFIPFGKVGINLPTSIWSHRKRLMALRRMIDSQIALIRDEEEEISKN